MIKIKVLFLVYNLRDVYYTYCVKFVEITRRKNAPVKNWTIYVYLFVQLYYFRSEYLSKLSTITAPFRQTPITVGKPMCIATGPLGLACRTGVVSFSAA